MNNSKIWLVVNPSLGVPLLLGTVAVSSFAVHYAIVTQTPWLADYYEGAANAAPAPLVVAAPAPAAEAPAPEAVVTEAAA
ncbi:light-harvesting protein, partial [Cereibacter changlensis]